MDKTEDNKIILKENPTWSSKIKVEFKNCQDINQEELFVSLQIYNGHNKDIFVLNQLWKLNEKGDFSRDNASVYRFYTDGILRILAGTCPLPNFRTVFYRNIPHAVMLKAGETIDIQLNLLLPAEEYNVYYQEAEDLNYEEVIISAIQYILQVVESQPNVVFDESPLNNDAVVIPAKFLKNSVFIYSAPFPIKIPVEYRLDEFSRFLFPNENPASFLA